MAASKLTGSPVELMLKYMSYNPLFCCVLCGWLPCCFVCLFNFFSFISLFNTVLYKYWPYSAIVHLDRLQLLAKICTIAIGSVWAHPHLTGLVFHSAWCGATLLHQLKTAGGAGLVADYLTMRHVVLGYMVPVAGAEQFWPYTSFWLWPT